MDNLAVMPLHAVTEMYGEAGLRARLDLELAALPAIDRQRITAALAWASELHAEDRRTREPYVNHLLRVCLRILHHYRITDADVLCAALLHDAVEDHAADIAPAASDQTGAALAEVAARFGDRVAGLVGAVTNPPWDPDRDAHEQYREHVRSSLAAEPWARVIKVSDFTDNAVGIVWTVPDKARRVAPKYLPLVDDLVDLIARPDTPLADDVKREIAAQLALGERRLGAVLDGA